MNGFYDLLLAAIAEKEPFALGIISSIKGSSPQKKGAKALFFADGRIVGTLGGGCLEAEVRERARLAIIKQQPTAFDLLLDHVFGWDDGLICGGKVAGLILPNPQKAEPLWRQLAQREQVVRWGVKNDFSIAGSILGRDGALRRPIDEPLVTERTAQRPVPTKVEEGWLYQETVSPPCPLWIAGSGHVAQAVAPMAQQLDFRVTVFDDRPALANHQNFAKETILRTGAWEKLLDEPMPQEPSFGLIVTRGHQHDALVLRNWVNRPFAFLGMIGSRRKKQLIFSQFVHDGIATEEQLSRVACPVGLDIDAVSVPEIAVSIVAQLVQQRAISSDRG